MNIKIFIFLLFLAKFSFLTRYPYSTAKLNRFLNVIRGQSNDKALNCKGCYSILFLFELLLKLGFKDNTIEKIAVEVCYLLRIEDKNVCSGSAFNFKDEVFKVLRDTPLAKTVICSLILQQKCSTQMPLWNVTFPNVPKPPIKNLHMPKAGSPVLKVLHLTDIHIDFKYSVGSNVKCLEPLCCRGNLTKGRGAGYWGSIGKCDLPSWTIEKLFSQLSKQQFDYILWTGDLPSHSSWDQDRAQQIYIIKYLGKLLCKYFPKLKVYPSVGNHESVPVDGFTQPFITGNISSSWLYETMYQVWSTWLPPTTKETITMCGYYTTMIKTGFRIISLNMNYCHYTNFWLLINETDPCSQLQWLIDVLQISENKKELVQIIGHIPPGSNDCVQQWSWNYYSIINRYEGIIVGQFFGHTHTDSFQMFYDFGVVSPRPVSVAYLAPSLTTYSNLNPGFRLYFIDGFYPNTTWYVLNHETNIMNLANSSVIWEKEYSAKEAYNMDCLWPSCWHHLWNLLTKNSTFFYKYYKYFYKSNMEVGPEECDQKCRHKMICDIYGGRSYDLATCPYNPTNHRHNLIIATR